jgi:Gpi18-like mannosyltransferase
MSSSNQQKIDKNPLVEEMSKTYANLLNSITIEKIETKKKSYLYEACISDLTPSRTKMNIYKVVKDMIKQIKSLLKERELLKQQLEEERKNNQQQSTLNFVQPNPNYDSYSKAVQKKPIEHVVI